MFNSWVNKPVSAAVTLAIMGSVGVVEAATTTFNVGTTPRYVATETATTLAAGDSAAIINLPAILIEVGSNSYINGDRVSLTVAGATLRSGADLSTITCATNGAANGAMKWVYSATLSSGNNIVMEVSDRSGVAYDAATSKGMQCTLPADRIKVLASSMTSPTSVTLSMSAAPAGGSAYDTLFITSPANTATQSTVVMAFSAPQFAVTPSGTTDAAGTSAAAKVRHPATRLEVDASTIAVSAASSSVPANNVVASTGRTFSARGAVSPVSETSANAANQDVIRYVVRNEEGAAGYADVYSANKDITATTGHTVTHTFTGDFSFLDDDANGCTVGDLNTGAGQVVTEADNVTGLTITTDCQTLTRTSTVDLTNRDTAYELRILLNGLNRATAGSGGSLSGRTIGARSFGLTVTWRNGSNPVYGTVNPTAGAWTNATITTGSSSGNIPYLPYGSGITRIVYVTNVSSTVAGVATISATGPSGTACASTNFASVPVAAGAVVQLSGQIDAGIRACFPTIDADSGKVNVNVVVTNAVATSTTSPSIELTSAYNVSGNRNVVINSTN